MAYVSHFYYWRNKIKNKKYKIIMSFFQSFLCVMGIRYENYVHSFAYYSLSLTHTLIRPFIRTFIASFPRTHVCASQADGGDGINVNEHACPYILYGRQLCLRMGREQTKEACMGKHCTRHNTAVFM